MPYSRNPVIKTRNRGRSLEIVWFYRPPWYQYHPYGVLGLWFASSRFDCRGDFNLQRLPPVLNTAGQALISHNSPICHFQVSYWLDWSLHFSSWPVAAQPPFPQKGTINWLRRSLHTWRPSIPLRFSLWRRMNHSFLQKNGASPSSTMKRECTHSGWLLRE